MKKSNIRPIAFVLAATNHGSMLVNRHDYQLTDKGGYGVGFQLLNNSSFDPDEVTLVIQLLIERRRHFGDGLITIDCGANIGVHTIEWAQLMYGWGEVIAFEAQERVFYALAGNIAMNNCFNARAIWAAVGKSKGTIGVPIPDYFVPSSFGSLEINKTEKTEFIGQEIDYSEGKTLPTKIVAIDNLNLDRLDFIKIDIEGMEIDALEGAMNSITKYKPQLLIEKIKSDEDQIRKIVTKLGYKEISIGVNLLAIHESDPVLELINSDNFKT
jgi:FkbM family methyltransferase